MSWEESVEFLILVFWEMGIKEHWRLLVFGVMFWIGVILICCLVAHLVIKRLNKRRERRFKQHIRDEPIEVNPDDAETVYLPDSSGNVVIELLLEQLAGKREAVIELLLKYDGARIDYAITTAEAVVTGMELDERTSFQAQIDAFVVAQGAALDAIVDARTMSNSNIWETEEQLQDQIALWRTAAEKFQVAINLLKQLEHHCV